MAVPELFVSGHWPRRGAASSRLAGAWRTARTREGKKAAEPRRRAWLGRAELQSFPCRNRSPNLSLGAAAMRWVRALLKNASLAGAPKYIEHFSKFSPSPLSMKQFLDFGTEWAGASGRGDPRGPEWVECRDLG